MCAYLKGLHLTLDVWKGNSDEEGYKKTKMEMILSNSAMYKNIELEDDPDAFKDIFPVLGLMYVLSALEFLLDGIDPNKIKVRLFKSSWISYGIGDAL